MTFTPLPGPYFMRFLWPESAEDGDDDEDDPAFEDFKPQETDEMGNPLIRLTRGDLGSLGQARMEAWDIWRSRPHGDAPDGYSIDEPNGGCVFVRYRPSLASYELALEELRSHMGGDVLAMAESTFPLGFPQTVEAFEIGIRKIIGAQPGAAIAMTLAGISAGFRNDANEAETDVRRRALQIIRHASEAYEAP